MNYLEQRLKAIGLDPAKNKFRREHSELDAGGNTWEVPIFEYIKDKTTHEITENIRINFWDINGEAISYYAENDSKMGHGKLCHWGQTRWHNPRGNKYTIDKGHGVHPFIPPNLVDAYRQGTHIENLYITEGAFKAAAAWVNGLYCFGLTSISHYADENGDLHWGIERVIKKCKVKNVIIIWDGDCLDISTNDLHKNKDIGKRPRNFYNYVARLRELIKAINYEDQTPPGIHFFHPKSPSIPTNPKGLDDLLEWGRVENKLSAILKQITQLHEKSRFFYKRNITLDIKNLEKYYRIHDAKKFYLRHQKIIENREFIFNGDIYLFNESAQELELQRPGWAKDYLWIGDNYFKIVKEVTAKNEELLTLKKRSKQTIIDITGQRNFFKELNYYEDFCNIPSHVNYKPVHNNLYNLYQPLPWTPKEGSIENSLDFIKHIFGTGTVDHDGKTYYNYELGLDYLQLLYLKPTQMLPVMVFYSAENATGKSTWTKWISKIFGLNTVPVSNSDFTSDFNEQYTSKLFAYCEETLLDKRKYSESIKSMSTSDRIMVNPKGFARYTIDFFCKFHFNSNHKKMLYLSEHDKRYWITQVPKPEKDNPNLMDLLIEEIPALLYHLKHRTLATEKESRMWFHPDLLDNDMLKATKRVNEPQDAQDLRHAIAQYFVDFEDEKVLEIPLRNILADFCSTKMKTPWLKEVLEDYMGVRQYMEKDKKHKKRGSYYKLDSRPTYNTLTTGADNVTDHEDVILKINFNGYPYVFHREDFEGIV